MSQSCNTSAGFDLETTGLKSHTLTTQSFCLATSEYDFTWTLDVHEVAVWALHKPLEFVLSFFFLHRGMQKIFEQLENIDNKQLRPEQNEYIYNWATFAFQLPDFDTAESQCYPAPLHT